MKTILSFTLLMLVVVVTNGQILFTNDSIFIDGKFTAIHTSILKPSSKVDSSDAIMMFAPISKSNKKIIKSTIGNPNQAPYRKHKESVVIHFIGATNDSNKILLAGYYLEESGVMQNNALAVSMAGLIGSTSLSLAGNPIAGGAVGLVFAVVAFSIEIKANKKLRNAGRAIQRK
jgi:hypothetical protein